MEDTNKMFQIMEDFQSEESRIKNLALIEATMFSYATCNNVSIDDVYVAVSTLIKMHIEAMKHDGTYDKMQKMSESFKTLFDLMND